LRKVAAAALAVPVLAALYGAALVRRSYVARAGVLAGGFLVVTLLAIGLARPEVTTASPPAPPVAALSADLFRSIDGSVGLRAPVTVRFNQPMAAASVTSGLVITPPTDVDLSWDATYTTLTITPRSHWTAGTYHTVSVPEGVLATTGRPTTGAIQAAFVTRNGTAATIAPTATAGTQATVLSGFRIAFDGAVDEAAVRDALRIEPAVDGTLSAADSAAIAAAADTAAATSTGSRIFTFTPSAPLTSATAYTVSLDGLVDTDGAAVTGTTELTVTTAAAPGVVRFRPANAATDIAPSSTLSVRFTQPMERTSTKAAWSASIAGNPIAGTVSFAEKDTVLVFRPAALLPAGATVQLQVTTGATSTAGSSLPATVTATFGVKAPAAPAPVRRTTPTPRPSTGGGAVGGGSWGAVETYYLKLMNCTRTGGWVTSTGACSSPGGRNVAPLNLDSGISSKVSRPYAKKLAVNNLCTHFSGGNPGDRLRAAGYTSYIWAENLGCRSGNPYSAVLGSHLFFQSEKSYNGGHYVNLMNAKYDRVGIGVWVSSGRVRLVVDFYHPR
jgi:uncharacterized protein YkwD